MSLLSGFFGEKKGPMIKVPAIGGEIRPATIVPAEVVRRLASRETVIVVLMLTAIALSGLNLTMAYIAQARAMSVPYVADGSPFGCQVEVPGQ